MPFCTNCGNELGPAASVCLQCGAAAPTAAGAAAGAGRRTEGAAVASLVLGILGLVMCPIILSIVAIVLGNQAQTRIQSDPSLEGEGMAKAGIITGWIGIGIYGLIFTFILLGAIVSAGALPSA